jgi:hypothetical protein
MARTLRVGFCVLTLVGMSISLYLFASGGGFYQGRVVTTARGAALITILFPLFLFISSSAVCLRSAARLQRGLWACASITSLILFLLRLLVELKPVFGEQLTWSIEPIWYIAAGLIFTAIVLRRESWSAYRKSRKA